MFSSTTLSEQAKLAGKSELMERELARKERKEIRSFTENDYDLLLPLIIDVARFSKHRIMYPRGIRPDLALQSLEKLQLSEDYFVLADFYDRPVGFVGVEIDHHFTGLEKVILHGPVVRPESSQSGFGSAMLEKAEGMARARGGKTLICGVDPANQQGTKFLHKKGFIPNNRVFQLEMKGKSKNRYWRHPDDRVVIFESCDPLDGLKSLFKQLYPTSTRNDADWQKLLNDPSIVIMVAERRGKAAAYLELHHAQNCKVIIRVVDFHQDHGDLELVKLLLFSAVRLSFRNSITETVSYLYSPAKEEELEELLSLGFHVVERYLTFRKKLLI
jgi:ribosomal protein S18 acetylase RimI-like enzyme